MTGDTTEIVIRACRKVGRPIVKLANTCNWTSGFGVIGFHAVNIAIHACNAALVYRLFARFVDRKAALIAAKRVMQDVGHKIPVMVSGTIEVFGVDLDNAGEEGRHLVERRWGVLFQQGALFSSLTCIQNVQFPMREYLHLSSRLMDEIAVAKLEMVGHRRGPFPI